MTAPCFWPISPQALGPNEFALYKPRWAAFFQTDLEALLREQRVSTLVFAGANFPNCPRTSIYEASERDFQPIVASDAISGLYPRGEAELAGIGVLLLSSDQVVTAMRAAPPSALLRSSART